jgi:outer membrane protein
VAQAVATLRPVVAFVGSTDYSEPALGNNLSASVALTAEMTLFDFGSNRLAVDAAREIVMATRQALIVVEQNVLLAAVQAYADMLRAAEFVRLREANVRLITEELRAANDRFEVGEITRTDVSIAEARLAGARANLAVAQGDLEVARAQFQAVVGRAPGALSGPGRTPATAGSLEEAQGVAVRTHPSIVRARHEVSAAEVNAERARLGTRGRITAGARIGMDDRGNDSASIGLNFRQPIYQGGGLSALYRQALARRDASRAALLESTVTVERDVANAWARLAVARAQIEASDRQIAASQVALQGVQEEASLGARTTLDVLNAEQELLDARTIRIDAGANQLVAVYGVLSSMGLLTVEHLQLGIPVYDPGAYYNAVRTAPATSTQGQRLDRVLRSIGRN